jgi:hypothetical protein
MDGLGESNSNATDPDRAQIARTRFREAEVDNA